MKIKKWNSSSSAWVQEYPEVNVDAIVATGTPSSTTYLRGDGSWATVTSGSTFNGGTITNDLVISKDNPVLVLKDTGETNDTDHVGYISFKDSANVEKAWVGFGSSGNTDFSISNEYNGDINLLGGNVGIGTASPTAKLTVVDSSTRGLEFEEITGGIMRMLAYDRTNTAEVPLELRGDSIDFETNGTRRFLITDSGAAVTGALTVGGTSVSLDGHTHTFASLTSKPTTLSGYGITDAYSSSNPSGYQTAAQVASTVSALVDSAPSTLDTLNELAAALGDDPNFATTVSTNIGTKVSKSGDTMTGSLVFSNDSTGVELYGDNALKKVSGTGIIMTTDSTRGLDILLQFERGSGGTKYKAFHDGYHPNADKWTTARTLSLTGDVTGSVSWDGSGNASMTTSVVNDSHDHTRLTERSTISYGAGWLQWTDQSGNGGAGTNGAAPGNPTNEWWHHLIMNHANSAGYYVDIAAAFHSDDIYFRRNVAGSLQTWRELIHSGNIGSQNVDRVDGYHIVVGSTGTDTNTLYFTT